MNTISNAEITPPYSLWWTFDKFAPGEVLYNARVGLCMKTTKPMMMPNHKLVNLNSGTLFEPREAETFISITAELYYNPQGMRK